MSNIFLISDTHWGHESTCTKFKREDGTPLRPFANADEMNAAMIDRWNKVVGDNDVVWNLGDVVINRRYLSIVAQLKGRKKLILGNHDIFGHTDYLKYFERIYGSMKIGDLWLTHIPVHVSSIPRWCKAVVHGHIHANLIKRTNVYNQEIIDSRYHNVSVEHIDYTPISLEDLHAKIDKWQTDYPLDDIITTR